MGKMRSDAGTGPVQRETGRGDGDSFPILLSPSPASPKYILVIAALLAGLMMVIPAMARYFPDVSYDHPRWADIDYVSNRGYFVGRGDGSFDPDAQISSGEMATVLERAFPDGMTRAQFATFIRLGEPATMSRPAPPSTTMVDGYSGSAISRGWKPAVPWSNPGHCQKQNYNARGTEYCIVISLHDRPSNLRVGWSVVHDGQIVSSHRPSSADGKMVVPIGTFDFSGNNPPTTLRTVAVYFVTDRDVLTMTRPVIVDGHPEQCPGGIDRPWVCFPSNQVSLSDVCLWTFRRTETGCHPSGGNFR